MKTGKQVSAWIGAVLVLGVLAAGVFAPLLAPSDPLDVHMAHRLAGPSAEYPLGTDHLGRCVLSRLLYGTRLSLFDALAVLAAVFAVSVPVGLLAGYAGGRTDRIIMTVIDVLLAFPGLILALAVAAMLGPGALHLLLAFAAVWWAGYARLIRGMVLQLKENDYVLAARASGSSHLRIAFDHILRGAARPILVLASMETGTILLSLAGLSFLGLGAQPPVPEWGVMLSDSRPYIQTEPNLMLFPGLAIAVSVLGFNLLAEGLREPGGPSRSWRNSFGGAAPKRSRAAKPAASARIEAQRGHGE
ncbi:ABC transporter permease subunit [Saccharibacillus sp. CPCC 101409]|uniref:ABC transporter permease n=1 Tax=Saccharibacillus sp. CPCC 101409 TaxID=3058041 RepID=UPI0026715A5D|nr:ABC transporter permease subunit [Saccharibacillus sp. CPCC 101409]MDO3410331.1 ABC transporter permease subunit [Saccharibacillus sp. CPCC 101409]